MNKQNNSNKQTSKYKSRNYFNGSAIIYKITKFMLDNIRNLINNSDDILEFYDEKTKLKKIIMPNENYYVPMGLFANPGFVLNCIWDMKGHMMPNKDNIKPNYELRDEQKLIIKKFENECADIKLKNKSAIYTTLFAECSTGKTIIAIDIIQKLKFKTFIITPSIELAKQWNDEINKKLFNINSFASEKGAKTLLQMPKEELNNFDIICFPSRHLSIPEFQEFLSNNFSVGIIDEQHTYDMLKNDSLRQFMSFNSFPVFISLTATPRKQNSIFFGRIIDVTDILDIHKPKTFKKIMFEISLDETKYDIFTFQSFDTYMITKSNKNNMPNKIQQLTLLKKKCIAEDMNRMKTISNNIIDSFLILHFPKIIVLTPFVFEIKLYTDLIKKNIKNRIKNIFNDETKFIVNNVEDLRFNSAEKAFINELVGVNYKTLSKPHRYLLKQYYKIYNNVFDIYAKSSEGQTLNRTKAILEEKKSYIIIGTEDHLGTGIDIKELNILHLVGLPHTYIKVIQYAGRVSRDNSSPEHHLYFYNVNSYKNIKNRGSLKIETEIENIKEHLSTQKWILKKMLK